MSITRLAHRAAVAAGALGLVAATVVPAGASTAPGWSVSQTLGPSRGVWGDDVVPTSAADTWARWGALGHFAVERWTGTVWSQVPVPTADLKAAKAAVSLGASSASNAWLFDHGQVVRWNGTQWNLQPIPKWVVGFSRAGFYFADTEVFGPRDVWVFSIHNSHYNGHTWARVSLPGGVVQVKALSPDDMWALSVTTNSSSPAYVLNHWDGTAWTQVPVPSVTPPPGASEYLGDLTVAGPTDIWVQRNLLKGSNGARTLYLLHWDGTTWTRVKFGFPTSFVTAMAQDGNGGLWLVANGDKPSYPLFLYHYSGGTWSETTVPAASGMKVLDVTGIFWVPGTQSLWADGNMTGSGNTIYGSTWGYSP